jgi:hypothetical protein
MESILPRDKDASHKEASQTRDYYAAENAAHRAARRDSLGKLGTGSSPSNKRLAQDDKSI